MRKSSFLGMVLLAALVLGSAQQAGAAPIILLSDRNSTAVIDPASRGLYNWVVDGAAQLYDQWFWYRVGAVGPESRVGTLGLSSWTSTSNTAQFTFGGPGSLEVRVGYTLFGGAPGSGWSDIAESISITNRTSGPIDLAFFEYSDFDLNGTIPDTMVRMVNANLIAQWDAGAIWSDTTVTPTPRGLDLGIYPSTENALDDAFTTNFPNLVVGASLGPGDLTWAFQWDVTLAPEGSFIISKDKNLHPSPAVPEPASLVLLGTGLVGVGRAWRKRRG